MPDKYHSLRSALIAALLPAIVGGKMGPSGVKQSGPVADVLSMVERSVSDPGVGWTGERQREYLDTIRQALSAVEWVGHGFRQTDHRQSLRL